MANSVTGDIYQVTIVGSLHLQTTMTTFHYRLFAPGVVPPTTTEEVAEALILMINAVGGLAPDYRACCPVTWLHGATWIQRIKPIRIIKSIFPAGDIPGERGATEVTNIQASITRRTELAARSGLGGIRVPLSTVDVDNGKIVAQLIASLNNLGQEMLNIIDISLDTGHLLEPILYGARPAGGFSVTPLFDAITQDTARVIRRRTVGLGI